MTTLNIVIKKNQETPLQFAYSGATSGLTPKARIKSRSTGTIDYLFEDNLTFASNQIVWVVTSRQANENYFPRFYEVYLVDTNGVETIVSSGMAYLSVPKLSSQPAAPVQIDPEQLAELYSRIGMQIGAIDAATDSLVINTTSVWGISASGQAYYDAAGVTGPDAASIVVTENGPTLVPLVPRNDLKFYDHGIPVVRGISQYIGPRGTSEDDGFEVQPDNNTLVLVPIDIPANKTTMDSFSIRVTQSNHLARLRFGLYTTGDSCDVFNLITEPTKVNHVSCATTGVKETVFPATAYLPKRVWFGICVQNAMTKPPTFAGITGRLVAKNGPNPMAKSVGYSVPNVSGALPNTIGVKGELLPTIATSVAVLGRITIL